MGHGVVLRTKKPDHLHRKRDTNITSVEQVQVPHTPQVAGSNHFGSDYYVPFESRESIFNDILEALRDDSISRVALYGMGGSGKTTLANHVGQRANELNIFNRVIFVPVRENKHVKKIQGEIAAGLGLRLEEYDLAARQRQISLRLRDEGRVLIILDDLWERVDLQEIGIPYDSGPLGCKLLLTSRSREIGYLMEFQVSFHLYLLNDEEALRLLMRHAGIYDGSPEVTDLAKKLAYYCKGLPLLISLVGSTLRGKTVDGWRKTLETLRQHSKDPYSSILSCIYSSIRDKVDKKIFLICSLFPKDHEISSEDLSQYAIRLGLCSKNESSAAINTLKDSYFLMHSDKNKDHVIMHDLIRDAALWMIDSENDAYKDSIREYVQALHDDEDFQWQEELDRLLRQLYGVREYPSSSTTNRATFSGGGEGHEVQVLQPYLYTTKDVAIAIPKPSGKLVDFYGLCQVDKSFIRLLKDACSMKPQLIESQRRHSEMLRQSAFDCLGRVLFLLHNVRKRDLLCHKDELEMFWEQLKLMKFDLDWLSPAVEAVFSSAEIARIEALREEENCWNEEAAKLRDRLKVVENKAAAVRTEVSLIESKLDGFAIAQVSNVGVVSKVTPSSWKKMFCRK